MGLLVLDANGAVHWTTRGKDPEAMRILSRLEALADYALEPPHFYAESYSAFYKLVRGGDITPTEMDDAFSLLKALPIILDEPPSLWRYARDVGLRYGLTRQTYDSVYLALAELHSLEFWSLDAALYDRLDPSPQWFHLLPTARSPRARG